MKMTPSRTISVGEKSTINCPGHFPQQGHFEGHPLESKVKIIAKRDGTTADSGLPRARSGGPSVLREGYDVFEGSSTKSSGTRGSPVPIANFYRYLIVR